MISLYDLLEAANGQLFGEPHAQLFTGFCLDSRLAEDNQIFVARKTDHGDTHHYIEEAIERGARGILCTRPPDVDCDGVSVVIVKDSEVALMQWSKYVLNKLRPKVVGVTGSSGKSVTVEAIQRVLGTRHKIHKSAGEYSGRLRLPLALAGLRAEHSIAVLEMGASQPGEISEMVQTVQPDVGVVTHIGYTHMDSFANLDQIAQEEAYLIKSLAADGLAVLNYDDDLIRPMVSVANTRVLTVSCATYGADMMAYNIVIGQTTTGFDLRFGSERYVGRWTPLLSQHHPYSILFALAVGTQFNVPLDEGLQAVTEMEPMPGRMNPLRGMNDCLLIDDTYDATPESTQAALDWLRAVRHETNSRTIFVMGDMDNLGHYAQRGHRMLGPLAAEVADIIVTEGPQAALIGRAAIDQGRDRKTVQLTYSLQDAAALLKNHLALRQDDIVLIKGGASVRMEQVVKGLLADEQDAARLVRQGDTWVLDTLYQPTSTTWIEINQSAIGHNIRQLKQMIGEKVTLAAVIKSDAYGHGATATGITALANGADVLAVATINEALELRDAGIEAPILVMNYTPIYAVRQAIRHHITLTLYDLDLAYAYNRAAREVDSRLRVHVKIDTGMGRLGLMPAQTVPFFRHLAALQNLNVEGVYTHFAVSAEDRDYTLHQLQTFKTIVNPLRASGFNFKYIHAANSGAALTLPETHLDMVRAGLIIYGHSPSPALELPAGFRPAMTWKTVIAQVKTLPPGHSVGYGRSYSTGGEERIAVLPVGYSHGFRRAPKNWRQVLVQGQFAPVIGQVSMEKSTIDVTHIPDVSIGDEVVLMGRQGDAEITASEIAERLGTNVYEVLSTVLARTPRH
jgi:alanine racemase